MSPASAAPRPRGAGFIPVKRVERAVDEGREVCWYRDVGLHC